MKNSKPTPDWVEGKVLDGIRWSMAHEKVADVWLNEAAASIQREGHVELRFDAVIAGNLAVEVFYYVSGTMSDAENQIAMANDRLAGIFSQASERRDELKVVLDTLRDKAPPICAALAKEGIEAHLVDTRLFDMVPTAIACHLLPSLLISWRNEHGALLATRISGMDPDDVFSTAIIAVSGTDTALAKRLLGLLASGSLGYAPAGTTIAERAAAMAAD